ATTDTGLVRIGRRKVGRGRSTSHVSGAGAIYGNPIRAVASAAPQVRGIRQCRAAGVDLRHECGWAPRTGVVGLKGVRCGKVAGLSVPYHVGGAAAIY